MRFVSAWLSVSISMLMCIGAEELPLPSWDNEERKQMIKEGWMAGGILLHFDSLPEEEEEPEANLNELDELPLESEILETENYINDKFLDEYFARKSGSFLVDPQSLLQEGDRKDIEEFLKYHSDDSAIGMYVYVFRKDEEIPGEVREEEIAERLYSDGKPSVLVFYFIGLPQRATVYISPKLMDVVSATEQIRAAESAVIKALSHTHEMEQLESFLMQMSIRIYWMERMSMGTASETMESKPGEPVSKIFQRAKKTEDSLTERIKPLLGVSAGELAIPFGLVVVFVCLFLWFRMSRRNVFPELEVEHRLGGNHAAGIGAVISFSNSSISPSSQRDQRPDSARRS